MITQIIAHLVGDWILQPRKMAVEKGKQTLKGYLYCLLHVVIYTSCFVVLIPGQSIWYYLSIGVPHFIIDKYSLMSYWQKLRDGSFWWESYMKEPDTFEKRLEMAFAGLRYALEDNTLHLICIYFSNVFLLK